MAKVWQKKESVKLHPLVEEYEVGSDYLLDGKLIKYELASSMAQAIMLNKINILSDEELKNIKREIKNLYKEYKDEIQLTIGDEDIHSKLENILTERLGETGKKIHTGRSRNDQICVVMRLFEKEQIINILLNYIDFLKLCNKIAIDKKELYLPGYTHTKQAMLTTVGQWLGSFVEAGIDNINNLINIYNLIDSNPLGSGSGFGVPLNLDRELTTKLLGFVKIQENPIHVQNSRGKYEALIIDGLSMIMNDFSRLAADMLIYNMDELLFIETNDLITTGSSIMPQKRNLDVMELIRARSRIILNLSMTVKTIINGLHSGYNRDLQETKEPVFKAFDITLSSIEVMNIVLQNINFNKEHILKSLTKGIFATDLAFRYVREGNSFREAYKKAAMEIDTISVNEDIAMESLKMRISKGSPLYIDFNDLMKSIVNLQNIINREKDKIIAVFSNLLEE